MTVFFAVSLWVPIWVQGETTVSTLNSSPGEEERTGLPEVSAETEAVGSVAVSKLPDQVEYVVQPDDVLQITVYEEPSLTTKVRVTRAVDFNFPLLGRVDVNGLSVDQIEQKLTELLAKDYLVNPQVNMFIETYHPRYVFVTGAVNKPGSYAILPGQPTKVMEAVTMAGGFNEEAAINSTRIIRLENNEKKTIQVPVKDIIEKGDKTKDVEVLPNDVVFVPESFF
jgi:polysaccharide export outer membrane protein